MKDGFLSAKSWFKGVAYFALLAVFFETIPKNPSVLDSFLRILLLQFFSSLFVIKLLEKKIINTCSFALIWTALSVVLFFLFWGSLGLIFKNGTLGLIALPLWELGVFWITTKALFFLATHPHFKNESPLPLTLNDSIIISISSSMLWTFFGFVFILIHSFNVLKFGP